MRRTRVLPVGCIALASLACSCRKELTAEAIEKSPDAIVEQTPAGTSTWIVRPDGAVSATLKSPDGKPVMQPVTGQVAFATPEGPPTSVPAQYDPKTGVLTAAGPKLEADITPVTYTLTAGGTPWTGSIDVPKGGTHDLVETAKLQTTVAPSIVGPNGGVVQDVGPDRVEIVANKHTGDVRAYVLDADNHPVDPGDRKITVALQGDPPEVLALAPEPQAHFVVGHMRALVDPPHLTVAVTEHGATHACLYGWSPGAVIVEGPEAPRLHLLAVDAWPGEVVEVRGPHGRHHGEVVVGAPGAVVDAPGVVVNGPSVVVGAPQIDVGAPGVVVGAPGVIVGAPGVVVSAPGVVVGAPGVIVGAPGVVVGAPGVALGAPGVVVGAHAVVGHPPGVAYGVGATVHGPGVVWAHGHDHGHGH
jgi:hypothetical protein